MPSIESFQPSEHTADERRVLVEVLLALRKTHIQGVTWIGQLGNQDGRLHR